jgi:hypothetical protein
VGKHLLESAAGEAGGDERPIFSLLNEVRKEEIILRGPCRRSGGVRAAAGTRWGESGARRHLILCTFEISGQNSGFCMGDGCFLKELILRDFQMNAADAQEVHESHFDCVNRCFLEFLSDSRFQVLETLDSFETA